ncbi:NAD(P)/FAD-dependent oxidoreductase [Micromonospora sp. CPCC 206061]|uniref:NAD(P)/FAD-dependent oxidoreductase n=1 Tax=Micromonospora sp. CPCC 206061 TaxID=3122410 RepID=UPI002FEF186E
MSNGRGTDYDAIVIGGGPSGSSYTITLTKAGYTVLLLERDKFPRFHIGESLLPYTADVLEQLGVLHKLGEEGFPIKLGLELSGSDGFLRRAALGDIGDGYRKWTYQVERADFDKLLLDSAAEQPGATVLEEAKVGRLIQEDGRVTGVEYTYQGETRGASARYVIDASGRAGVLARGLGLRTSDANLKMAAVYKHFGNLDESRNPGYEGDTQIGVHENGWLWAIPIRKDVISVGAMMPASLLREFRPEDLYAQHLKRLPRIEERIEGTNVYRELSGEQNFEYHANTLAGPGFFIIGDAGCFSDPVFSAGVYLALVTGRRAAEETIKCLTGEEREADVAERYGAFFKTGYETYYRLIRAVYDNRAPVMGRFIQQMFRESGIHEKWRVRTLNGDFWTDTNPFVNRLRAEPGWDLFGKYDRLYGCPVHGERQRELQAR